jgi:hypothetical protein
MVHVSAASEARIRELCSAAVEAKSEADVERVLAELRAALEEHIQQAKHSLEEQAENIPFLDTILQRGLSGA